MNSNDDDSNKRNGDRQGIESSLSSLADAISSIDSSTLTSDSATVSASAHRNYIAKSYLQKNELVTEVQMLRLEVKKKADELENLQAHMALAADDHEDKVDDLRRENARLRQMIVKDERIASEDMKRHDQVLKRELCTLMDRVRALEDLNLRLTSEQSIAKDYFKLVKLTEAEYSELKAAELKDDLSLSEMVSVRVYEELRDSIEAVARLEDEKRRLEEGTKTLKLQVNELQALADQRFDETEQLRWTNIRLEKRLVNVLGPGAALSMPQSLFEPAPATSASKTVPDHVENDIDVLRVQLNSVNEHLTSERERLVRELDSARDALRIAADENAMLRRQSIDSSQRSAFLEERLTSLSAQMDTLKNAREELLEKYLASKEEAQSEYNSRLMRELDDMRTKSNAEYERLQQQMKDVFELEAVSLRQARDAAVADRDRSQLAEADARSRYENVLVEFKNLEFSLESQTAELVSQLRVKSFELDRLRSMLEETDANLRASKEAHDSVREKFEALLRDHQAFVSESGSERKRLEEELESARNKIRAYDRTEADLDDLVMQAADTNVGDEAERVLVSYGAVAAVPASFRRRLEQSVRLARRVLELERINNTLRTEFDKKTTEIGRLGDEVADLNSLLSISKNPDQKLIVEAVRAKDEELRTLKARLTELEIQLDAARHELTSLAKEKEEMAQDMQTLLSHRDELAKINQQLNKSGCGGRRDCISPNSPTRKAAGRRPAVTQQKMFNNNAFQHNISPPVLLS